jgi:hypothetical protein
MNRKFFFNDAVRVRDDPKMSARHGRRHIGHAGRVVKTLIHAASNRDITYRVSCECGGEIKREAASLDPLDSLWHEIKGARIQYFCQAVGVSGEDELYAAMSVLSQREIDVLMRRYGIGEEKRPTRKQIGYDLGVTSERVRQIEVAALKKISIPSA